VDHIFPQQIFQIPRARVQNSASDFPDILINFLWPQNPTKYAVFVAGISNWQI